MFTAALGGGAHLNGGRLSATRLGDEPGAQILASRPNFAADHWPGGLPRATRTYRPSLAYRMALVGEGRFDGMVTFRDSWEWDIAAGALIATEAGAEVTDRDGAPLRFNNPTPLVPGVITAGAPLHAALMARRRSA